ncbi:MAG: type I polyketide synthase [Paracoccaceae bacterium]
MSELAESRLPEWTEDSFPGILLNVIAGRIANRFDLGGVNFTVDAACGSSLAAVMMAAREIENGSADMAIVGGADSFQNPFDFLAFAKTRALSPRGRCRTFDAGADGIAISEGLATMVLRPLDQAERAGDRIYAVLRGVAGASDGRDLSLTAPRAEGQQETLRRAYARAGISPGTVSAVEAHGTGTVVGDRTEIESLSAVFAEARGDRQFCGVGSVKSMIGHTKAAAGCAGIAKMALALHHRVLPSTLNVEVPNPTANFPDSPFYVMTEARPWLRHGDTPRRAGVSAFGFGGTNFHAVLEEYEGGYLPRHQEPFRRNWSHELFVFSAADAGALKAAVEAAAAGIAGLPDHVRMAEVAASLAAHFDPQAEARLSLVAGSLAEAAERLAAVAGQIDPAQPDLRQVDVRGAFLSLGAPLTSDEVAFLFPGQGSQYPGMAADLAMTFPALRMAVESAGRIIGDGTPAPLGDLAWPRPTLDEAEAIAQAEALKATNVAQPAIGAVSAGMLDILRGLGLAAGQAAGHSFGEYTALHAAGAFDVDTLVSLAFARGDAIVRTGGDDLGAMIAVSADAAAVREAVSAVDGITLANINAPDQTVIAGPTPAIEKAAEALTSAGLSGTRLPVACGFHSDCVAPARDLLASALEAAPVGVPGITVMSNETAAPYPGDAAQVKAQLARHLVSPVDFLGGITAMHERGARLFIEVGPGSVLTRLADRILGDAPHLAVSTDVKSRGGVQQFLTALAAASAAGLPLALGKLFERRADSGLDVVGWVVPARETPKLLWKVDAANARPAGGAPARRGFAARIEEDPVAAPVASTPVVTAPARETTPAPVATAQPVASAEAAAVLARHQALMQQFLQATGR